MGDCEPQLTLAQAAKIKLLMQRIRKKLERRRMAKRMIFPNSRFRFNWDVANFLLLIFCMFEVPFSLCYETSVCAFTPLDKFNLSVDVFFLCDFCLNFFTAYKNPETGVLVVDPKLVAKSYLKSWACFDFMSSFPFDLCICLFISNSQVLSVKFVRVLKLLRFVR